MLVGAGLPGCSGGGEDRTQIERPTPAQDAELRVVLGTGRAGYVALADEPVLPLIRGIQEGYHVWVAFLSYGFETDVLRMDLATELEGEVGSHLEEGGAVAVVPVEDGEGRVAMGMWGWPAQLHDPECAHGKRLVITLTVSDEQGAVASDSRSCQIDVPEQYRATDCQ